MASRFFTLLADYDGGTFISQCEAIDPRQEVIWWANEQLERLDLLKLGRMIRERIRREFSDSEMHPTALAGLQNAWCGGHTLIRGKVLLLNVVETRKVAIQPPQTTTGNSAPDRA